MDLLFDPVWIQRIIAYLFPYPFTRCDGGAKGCIPADHLGL